MEALGAKQEWLNRNHQAKKDRLKNLGGTFAYDAL